MDHAKRISADDSLIVKVKMSVDTGSIHTYVCITAAISDFRLLLESPRYTSCKFAMIECRRFAVGILLIHVISLQLPANVAKNRCRENLG